MIKTFKRTLNRLSLTTKVILLTAAVGLVSWLLAGWYQSHTLRDVYRENLIEQLKADAFEGRILVHKEFNAFFKLGKFITSNVNFSEYISSAEDKWVSGRPRKIKIHKQLPPWYPDASLVGLFPSAHFALLIDPGGEIREIYVRNSAEYPDFLRNPMEAIPQLTWDSSFLTLVDDEPYAITSDTLADASGNARAILLLVTPIGDEFVFVAMMPDFHDPVVLIDGISSTVLASSNPRLIPRGAKLDSLEDSYLIIGEPFFDYGNSDLLIRFAAFTPKEKIRQMTEAFISQERFKRAASIFVIVSIFSIIMVQISRRISNVTRRIEDFSSRTFGGEPEKSPKGDELELLEERFHNLTETVVSRTTELIEEERSHRMLAENLPGIVYRLFLGDDGRVQFFNDMLEPLTGYTKEELEFDGICCTGSLIVMDDWYVVVDKVQKAVSANQPFEIEYRIKCKGGYIRYCIERGMPVCDDNGKVSHIDGIILDITERKKAENEIMRQREELYRLVKAIEAVPVGVTITDINRRIVYTNPAEAMMHGYRREDLLGRDSRMLAPPELKQDIDVLQVPSLKPFMRESVNIRNDGSEFPVELSSVHIIDDAGQPIGFISICKDISERKHAERRLSESRSFLKNILDSLQDGLCIIGADRVVVMANRTMEKWFGYREAVVGRKCFEVIRERGEACVPCLAMETMKTGQSSFDTVPFRRPGGTKGWLDVYSFPLRAMQTDEVTGVILYLRDITDKVALQSEAARTAQLASLGELAAGVAHEINNPMNGIINYAQILANKIPNGREGDIARRIIKEGDRVSEIVKSLLSFAREEGISREPVHVSEMLSEVLSLIGSQLRKEGIRLVSDVVADLPEVNVNRQQMEQVFLNVINNARHALRQKYPTADEDSVIEIWAEAVSFSGDYYVRVTFRDRGVGIPKDLLSKVASPFFTTKPRSSGTGLGLSISQNIINNHGGRLAINSVEGEYAQVAIDLPQRRESDG